ncbi:MAG TPA: acyloxyacyl hydrolase [Stellaceae bacterium]|jgi:lipid A 3-O-deacylase|nr:acyloxyacyl hydrolase [Stellaceae bacterium]
MAVLRGVTAALVLLVLPVAAAAQTPVAGTTPAVTVGTALPVGAGAAPAAVAGPAGAPPPGALAVGEPQPPLAALPAPIRFVNEVKIGVLANDIAFLGRHVEAGTDVNLELLFDSPALLKVIGSPRPDLGMTINSAGETQRGYAGLTWGVTLIHSLLRPDDGIFLNGSLGGAYQDGYTNSPAPQRKELGSPVLFRESIELGYQATARLSLSAFIEHMSNADLAPHNDGMTDAGARIGIKF